MWYHWNRIVEWLIIFYDLLYLLEKTKKNTVLQTKSGKLVENTKALK